MLTYERATMSGEFLSITALARKTGVSSKALRYWERLGLLPKAARSPAGYRRFSSETAAYVKFVSRSKAMGLTLQQMRAVLKLARTGCSPCVKVETWIEQRIRDLETEIQSLSRLRRSLKKVLECQPRVTPQSEQPKECCSLLVGLPEPRRFSAIADTENRHTPANPIAD